MASAGTTPGVVSAKGGHVNHHQSTAREKDGAKGPPGRRRHGASEAAQGSQAVALKGSNHEMEAHRNLEAC